MSGSVASLDDEKLLELLFTEEDRLPRAAADEIVRRGSRSAPRLAAILSDPGLWDADPPRCWAPFHATFLLAAIRPAGSFDAVVGGLERATELFDDLIGDAAPSILAGYVGPSLDPVKSLLKDPGRDDYLRQDACTALVCAAGLRRELLPEVATELRAAAVDATGSRDLRALAASHLLGLLDPRDREFLSAFERNECFDRDYVDEAYERQARLPAAPPEDWLAFYDSEAIAARQRALEEEHGHGAGDLDEVDPGEFLRPDLAGDVVEAASAEPGDAPAPFRRELAKVGRNDPCPCGSGAKFKKCCGR